MSEYASSVSRVQARVPEIITLYWVIKIASTTLGETGADLFSMTWDLGYAVTIAIFLALFVGSAILKISQDGYRPVTYWLAFTASAIAGTAISDFIDRTLGLGYAAGSLLLVALLVLILLGWQKAEGSVRVEDVRSRAGEVWYWLAFLVANTLGTAAGDFLADDMGLGFAMGAVLISSVLLAILLAWYWRWLPNTLLFWLAFVLTRPFGATFGDWLTKPLSHGGLALGTAGSSVLFALVVVVAVFWEQRRCQQQLLVAG
ncbi:COG4705 family protein [Parathalassolituus penaei]|uniref:Membrane-anchored protein n=1 Tax=Parathalassolituus penaei TaxID=2997323 RepID=A0A9X3EKM6_9GAMM|nr:hypothetical protein [Parathalassolituus penaei]MCY0966076.1 hypothetical protein [Parathalassolituus penaei]